MNKTDELKQLGRVFGEHASKVIEHERPDFLLNTQDNSILGIEVTSIYASNADAKLKLLSGYSTALLDKTQQLHRADKGQIKVDEFSLLNEDGTVATKMTGILQEMPSKIASYGNPP
jgi:hypothetical protein